MTQAQEAPDKAPPTGKQEAPAAININVGATGKATPTDGTAPKTRTRKTKIMWLRDPQVICCAALALLLGEVLLLAAVGPLWTAVINAAIVALILITWATLRRWLKGGSSSSSTKTTSTKGGPGSKRSLNPFRRSPGKGTGTGTGPGGKRNWNPFRRGRGTGNPGANGTGKGTPGGKRNWNPFRRSPGKGTGTGSKPSRNPFKGANPFKRGKGSGTGTGPGSKPSRNPFKRGKGSGGTPGKGTSGSGSPSWNPFKRGKGSGSGPGNGKPGKPGKPGSLKGQLKAGADDADALIGRLFGGKAQKPGKPEKPRSDKAPRNNGGDGNPPVSLKKGDGDMGRHGKGTSGGPTGNGSGGTANLDLYDWGTRLGTLPGAIDETAKLTGQAGTIAADLAMGLKSLAERGVSGLPASPKLVADVEGIAKRVAGAALKVDEAMNELRTAEADAGTLKHGFETEHATDLARLNAERAPRHVEKQADVGPASQ